MACTNVDEAQINCPHSNNGLSQREIEDIIIPLLQNRTGELQPKIIETPISIRVEFAIEYYRKYGSDSIFSQNKDFSGDEFKAAAAKLIKRQPSRSEWIPVGAMNPENGQRVLIVQNRETTATREALFAVYIGGRFIPPAPTYFADYEMGRSVWADVTHWMPLPAVPC